MKVADWSATASAVAAAIALFLTWRQLRLLNRQAAAERRVALDGVAVSWRAVEAPDHPEEDGSAEWLYEIAVHNPGRLPIDDIHIRWVFPCEVRRVRYSGTLGPPVCELVLRTPVLAGGDARVWKRRLRIDFGQRRILRKTFAEVSFGHLADEAGRHRNRWPRRTESASLPSSAED